MAQKKPTQAEIKAAGAQKKTPAGSSGSKSTPPKKKNPEKVKKSNQDFAGGLSPNVLAAVLCACLFVLFLVIAINPGSWACWARWVFISPYPLWRRFS